MADMGLAVLTLSYPLRELSTFDKQESEARDWTANNTAPTRFLSALAKTRVIPLPNSLGGCLPRLRLSQWLPAPSLAGGRDWRSAWTPVRPKKNWWLSRYPPLRPGGIGMTYGQRTLIAIDQLVNTLLDGWPNEILPSRYYRWAWDGVRTGARCVVDGLFF